MSASTAGSTAGSGQSALPQAGASAGSGSATGGSSGAAVEGGTGGSAVAPDGTIEGCAPDIRLLPLPEDPGERGPWKVGVRTVQIGRLTVEIVYPAQPGSTQGMEEAFYDLRVWLPQSERGKIPDEASPDVKPLGGAMFRDVPIDAGHGPYPAVIHIHGTSAMRIASGSTMVHWASHGFVVLAADHPGLWLADQLATDLTCGYTVSGEQNLPADVAAEIAALENPSGDLAFLGTSVDTSRIAINGHSQGGCTSAELSTLPNVKIVIPFSGSYPALEAPALESMMFVGGTQDVVIAFEGLGAIGNWVCPIGSSTTRDAYIASPGPPNVKKRLLGITNGGHLAPTDLCQKNALGKSALEEMVDRGVCGVDSAAIIGLAAIFDCGPTGQEVAYDQSLPPINYATTAALEETLLCQDRTAAFAQLKTRYPIAGVFEETL